MRFSLFVAALWALMAHAAPAPNPEAPRGSFTSVVDTPSSTASSSPVAYSSPSAATCQLGDSGSTAPSSSASAPSSSASSSGNQQGSKRYVAYWNIWAGPTLLPSAEQLTGITHVVLAFVNVTTSAGAASPDTAGWPTETTPFQQSDILSLQNAGIKVMLAVGGWNLDNAFRPGAADPTSRDLFTNTVVNFANNLGLDGIDMDWEYPVGNGQNYLLPEDNPMSRPRDDSDAANFVELAKEFRKKLDAGAKKTMYLSLAAPSRHVDMMAYDMPDIVSGLDGSVDWWNLMTYDFINRRDTVTQYHAGGMVIADSLAKYKGEYGIKPEKLNIGFPMYSKWFEVQSSCTADAPINCQMGVKYEGSQGEDLGTSGAITFNPATNDNTLMVQAFAQIDQNNFSNQSALGSATIATYQGKNYFWTWLSATDVEGACSKYLPEAGGAFFWALNQDNLGQSGGDHIAKLAACVGS